MIGARGTRALRFGFAAALLALLAGCANSPPSTSTGGHGGLESALASVPHRSVAPMPATRLAKGLIPPTNRWFSGLVFGNSPNPVFPLPLSFGLTPGGFAFGVPAVTTGANTITGEYAPSVTVDDSSTSAQISAYDEASVTIAQRAADGATVGSVVIAEGSPVVSYTAARGGTLRLGQTYVSHGAGLLVTTIDGLSYGLLTKGHRAGNTLRLAAGQTAVWFAVPKGQDAAQLAPHVSALESVSLAYRTTGTTVSTTLDYHSVGKTLVAALPSQLPTLTDAASCTLGHFPTVYGSLALCAGSTLAWTSPTIAPSGSLDASKLSSADRSELRGTLAKDIASTAPLPTDSYFGGKALYRLANLLTVAHDVGDSASAATLQKQLGDALRKWATPGGCTTRATQCFVYDPTAKGMVGLAASFGSDQFNDHHFHYGYFLYAAAVAAKYDPALRSAIAPVINLLAADIASPEPSKSFPQLRVFDAYAGHSWASGYVPFADGNNQESSSEAVDAWNGLALWGAATGNTRLQTEATWLLSSEAASAKANWTNFDTGNAVYAGYAHGVVGINWGAKRDWATWFSADANAKLGIQLIPMSPASTYLAGDAQRIAANIREAAPGGYDVTFGDYLLMYSALEGKAAAAAALTSARSLPDTSVDDGDSRTYLLAWIMTR